MVCTYMISRGMCVRTHMCLSKYAIHTEAIAEVTIKVFICTYICICMLYMYLYNFLRYLYVRTYVYIYDI